jgi:hypothetical protein
LVLPAQQINEILWRKDKLETRERTKDKGSMLNYIPLSFVLRP